MDGDPTAPTPRVSEEKFLETLRQWSVLAKPTLFYVSIDNACVRLHAIASTIQVGERDIFLLPPRSAPSEKFETGIRVHLPSEEKFGEYRKWEDANGGVRLSMTYLMSRSGDQNNPLALYESAFVISNRQELVGEKGSESLVQ